MRYLVWVFLVACSGRASRPERPSLPPERQITCSGADLSIPTSAQCESWGVCYQLADGSWCTSTYPAF